MSGRPKRDAEFAAACRERAPRILAMLEKSLRSSSWREQHSAAGLLLAYGFGRPQQHITTDGETSVTMHLLACQTIGAVLHGEALLEKPPPTLAEPQAIDLSLPPIE
jgi:hypothetical protein